VVREWRLIKACVVGDTVGDPFEDTSEPALNILVKLMSRFLDYAPVIACQAAWEKYTFWTHSHLPEE